MINIDDLEEQFAIEGEVGFAELEGELPFISIFNKFADVDICLQGAQITTYRPQNGMDVLWMSPDNTFDNGKPIRGGIPICFPWFGPAGDKSLPAHGFARNMVWNVLETKSLPAGETLVKLILKSNNETKTMWPFEFEAVLSVQIGSKLTVMLTITNTGKRTFTYGSALHSYFNVSSVEHIGIDGLQNVAFYEEFGTELFAIKEPLRTLRGHVNSRYIDHEGPCAILDTAFMRTILVEKTGSKVTVLWNPGAETCGNFADIPEDGFHSFVCLEAVNAYNDMITLEPGSSHTTGTTISCGEKGINPENSVLKGMEGLNVI